MAKPSTYDGEIARKTKQATNTHLSSEYGSRKTCLTATKTTISNNSIQTANWPSSAIGNKRAPAAESPRGRDIVGGPDAGSARRWREKGDNGD